MYEPNAPLSSLEMKDNGKLPFRLLSSVNGNVIEWSKEEAKEVVIKELDITLHLPIFIDGIRDCKSLYSDVAFMASMDVLRVAKNSIDQKLARTLLSKIRLALYTYDPKVLRRITDILILMSESTTLASSIVSDISFIIFPLTKAFNAKVKNAYDFGAAHTPHQMNGEATLKQKLLELFSLLEVQRGSCVTNLLKSYIPCYKSSIDQLSFHCSRDGECIRILKSESDETKATDQKQPTKDYMDKLVNEPYSSDFAKKVRGTMVVMKMKSNRSKENTGTSDQLEQNQQITTTTDEDEGEEEEDEEKKPVATNVQETDHLQTSSQSSLLKKEKDSVERTTKRKTLLDLTKQETNRADSMKKTMSAEKRYSKQNEKEPTRKLSLSMLNEKKQKKTQKPSVRPLATTKLGTRKKLTNAILSERPKTRSASKTTKVNQSTNRASTSKTSENRKTNSNNP